ncbi:protein S40-4 [Cornus florida]|uniref:protein S40-4 n=1 Tax=Cornus florida TaxID=4283 RepID=UPI00289B8F99|nr:protein S40-4 [Cornus florida]
MAASKSYFARPNYRFLSGGDRDSPISTDTVSFELDESDVWNSTRSGSPEFRKPVPSSRFSNRAVEKRAEAGATPSSLPVNVPDWSKILKEDYRDQRRRDGGDDDEDDVDCGGNRIPPHELLARTRIASFSVHEGIGRTLKGRDLSRVRNAIWEKTGFQD